MAFIASSFECSSYLLHGSFPTKTRSFLGLWTQYWLNTKGQPSRELVESKRIKNNFVFASNISVFRSVVSRVISFYTSENILLPPPPTIIRRRRGRFIVRGTKVLHKSFTTQCSYDSRVKRLLYRGKSFEPNVLGGRVFFPNSRHRHFDYRDNKRRWANRRSLPRNKRSM